MDQKKIGGFIAARRKDNGLTQSLLAEKLGITDKAVSKWETGKSMPDISLFGPLCGLLQITCGNDKRLQGQRGHERSFQYLLDLFGVILCVWVAPVPSGYCCV